MLIPPHIMVKIIHIAKKIFNNIVSEVFPEVLIESVNKTSQQDQPQQDQPQQDQPQQDQPPNNYIEYITDILKYLNITTEEFNKSPINTINKIYDKLSTKGTEDTIQNITNLIKKKILTDIKKNKYYIDIKNTINILILKTCNNFNITIETITEINNETINKLLLTNNIIKKILVNKDVLKIINEILKLLCQFKNNKTNYIDTKATIKDQVQQLLPIIREQINYNSILLEILEQFKQLKQLNKSSNKYEILDENNLIYYEKYIKYKTKYLALKNL